MAVGDSAGLFENLPDAVVAYNSESGEIIATNDACCEMVGYGERELRGTDVSSLEPIDEPSALPSDPRRLSAARSEERIRSRGYVETSAGEALPVEATLSLASRDGRELVVASIRERECTKRESEPDRVRDRYRALYGNGEVSLWEFDLSEAKRRVDSLAEKVDDIVAYLDDNPGDHEYILKAMRVLDVNERAVEFYEADSKEELIRNVERVMTEHSVEKLKQLWATIADDGTDCRFQCAARTLEGNRRHLVFELVVPEAHADDYARVYVTGLDITEYRRRERELAVACDARRALHESLADATSTVAFADTVCTELTAIDPIAFAWIGTPTPGDSIDVVAEAGEPGHDADPTLSAGAQSPAVLAVRKGETRRVRPSDDGLTETPASGSADVIAVPATSDCVTHGVLVVHVTSDPMLSEERIRTLIEEAADVIGYALEGAARRRALAVDDEVELTAAIDSDGVALADALRAADADATVTAAIPLEGESVLCYLAVERGDPVTVIDAARETGGVERADRNGAPAEDRVGIVTTDPVPNAVITEAGGRVIEAHVHAGRTAVTARFPRGTPFEPVLDALADQFGDVVLTEYTTEPTNEARRDSPLADLTDRQREVLEAAFMAGYFERPRTRDAGTVADSLGVSRQAYQQVLRAAERNLLSRVFDGNE